MSWSKDSASVLDYTFDWTPWLAGDLLNSATFNISGVDNALVIDDNSFILKKATILLSGGTPSEVYTIVCSITTEKGLSNTTSNTLVINS